MKKSVFQHVSCLVILIVVSSLSMSAQVSLTQKMSVIRTENGLVSGYNSGDITILKGIPFAAPPVGELRWKAPQPVKN